MRSSEKTTFRLAVESALCSSARFMGWGVLGTRYYWFAFVLMFGAAIFGRSSRVELQARTEALTPQQQRVVFCVHAFPPVLLAVVALVIALLIRTPILWVAAGGIWLFIAPLLVVYYYRIYNDRSKVA